MLYFGLVILLSLPFWLLGALTKNTTLLPAGLPVAAFMAVCPMLAAVILVYIHEGRDGMRLFWSRTWAPTGQARGYLAALVFMPAIMIACYVAMRLAGMPLSGIPNHLADSAVFTVALFTECYCRGGRLDGLCA